MRALIVAGSTERRSVLAGLVRQAGHEAAATGTRRLALAVTETRPQALVVDAGGDPERARADVGRARAAAEAMLPVVLLLPSSAAWLHGPLPAELQPAVALAGVDAIAGLAGALGRVLGAPAAAGGTRAGVRRLASLMWLAEARAVAGPSGRATLTASEARIFDLVFARAGAVVPAGTVAQALWGDIVLDAHARAAIRSHVHTLRRKLRAVGLPEVVVSLPGLGYRLASGDHAEESNGPTS